MSTASCQEQCCDNKKPKTHAATILCFYFGI
ncbi:hypothetical protein LTSEMIN_3084, partial [Salmonella enterica subsp. enterica serovar Minnesota str. A4-603]